MSVPLPAENPPSTPRVSVVIATYNRANTLRHAIRSVVASSYTDWELIVVGDACTDDTDQCVASFDDPRIRYVNLDVRCGYQSGPHNHGIAIANGTFIAFLNHDDFYLHNHLAHCVAQLDDNGADLVWAPYVAATRILTKDFEPEMKFRIAGVPPEGAFSPLTYCPPTTWVLRREFARKVGPWLLPDETALLASQEWLYRASRLGTLRFVPHIGVIKVAVSPGAYTSIESTDHEWLEARLKTDPGFPSRITEAAALMGAMQTESDTSFPDWVTAARLLRRPLYSLMLALGRNPAELNARLHLRNHGSLVRRARRNYGA